MLEFIRDHDEIKHQYDIELINYKTGPLAVPILKRLPTVAEIGSYIGDQLHRFMYGNGVLNRYIDATLVGHSMGGLAIKAMLTQMLAAGRGNEFDFIRQAIFFATPHYGSLTMSAFREFLGTMVDNPQDDILRGFNDDVAELHEQVNARIVQATKRDTHKYPLPMTAFWGLEDNIVPKKSAVGGYDAAHALPGGHLEIHCPTAKTPDAYQALVDALEQPYGHSAIYEVDLFRYSARVLPLPPGTTRTANLLNRTKNIITDNEAFVTREVTFSTHNVCTDDFELKYRTNDFGYIDPLIIPAMQMRPDHRSAYNSGGTAVNFGVPAGAGLKYTLNMGVLNGFSIGNRDFHQHFTNKCYFRRVRFELDLTAYIAKGWHVTDSPKLYYHPTDSDDHELCKSRDWCTPDPASGHQQDGKWMWELEFITNGVLDLKWDVAP